MSAWTEALDAIYEDPEFSIELQVLDAAGDLVAQLRALPDLADKTDLYGQRRSVIERNVYRIRVYELAAKAPDFMMTKQGQIRVGGRQLTITNTPQHPDDRRLELQLDCA